MKIKKYIIKAKNIEKKFIKSLKHDINDEFMFRETVHGGITDIVPFRNRGNKLIETKEEAFKAAENFAKYVS